MALRIQEQDDNVLGTDLEIIYRPRVVATVEGLESRRWDWVVLILVCLLMLL